MEQQPLRTPSTAAGWRRACVACTKAKRQCSKQTPKCQRCTQRGLRCIYLPARRTDLASGSSAEGETDVLQVPVSANQRPDPSTTTDGLDMSLFPLITLDQLPESLIQHRFATLESTTQTGSPSNIISRNIWFLAPESWAVERRLSTPEQSSGIPNTTIKSFISHVKDWLHQWVTNDRSPLHHKQLYAWKMPRWVQDAYSATAMYMAKTPNNEENVHRILEDRVNQLLEDQALTESLNGGNVSVFDHLSRVQSLLAYQIMRLFDGDIRMREQAERLISKLFQWNEEMLACAEHSSDDPEGVLSTSFGNLYGSPEIQCPLAETIWRTWVIAESIRRTWQTVSIVQGMYLFLKRGWDECPGRVTSTMRQGLWNAPTAYTWTKTVRECASTLLVSTNHLGDVFSHNVPADIDPYSMVMLEVFDMEKFEHWVEDMKHFPMLPPWGGHADGGVL
ncbi:hypothetical protein F5Y15DRAFT_317993 [Xylariaceae sp. FL0016]|nr:hypothetical protein F5Y15DRAFT_317993 [Xylariaceae sp. FL0016]